CKARSEEDGGHRFQDRSKACNEEDLDPQAFHAPHKVARIGYMHLGLSFGTGPFSSARHILQRLRNVFL
ncbi:MAG: hypothetical protein ACI38S_07100, partial [Atopobiaceae bacterium]